MVQFALEKKIKMIPIYKPFLSSRTQGFAQDAISSTWISSTGKYKELASEKLKEILGIQHVLLTSNGTTATHLVSKSLKWLHPEIKTILVPNNVYVAAWNSFLFDKEYNLIPIDADKSTWNFDVNKLKQKLEEYQNKVAVLVVSNLGNVVNVPRLKREHPGAVFVEDNCEGLFGKYEEHYSGTQSLASSLSFYGNKTITCGEGGAVLTNCEDIYVYLDKIHGQGQKRGSRYIHDTLGYNYRMTNVAASLLYGQLLDLDEILERKAALFEVYRRELGSIENINMQAVEENTHHANWMMGIRTPLKFSMVEEIMNQNDIEIRPMFFPMSSHNHLVSISKRDEEKNASILSDHGFMIPSYPTLEREQINHIIETIKGMVHST